MSSKGSFENVLKHVLKFPSGNIIFIITLLNLEE